MNDVLTSAIIVKDGHSTMDSILTLHPVAPGSILGARKKFSLDAAEIY